jgi:hypothetical protein
MTKQSVALSTLLSIATVGIALMGCTDQTSAPGEEDIDSEVDTGDGKSDSFNPSKLQVFDCKTLVKVDGKIQRMQFAVKNITKRSTVTVLTPEGNTPNEEATENGIEEPIKVTPVGERVMALNENIGVSTGTRMLKISGDSDGFFLIELALFKNTNYKHGFLRIFGGEDDGPNQFSKVSCKVTQR